jgi:hypothetical protein
LLAIHANVAKRWLLLDVLQLLGEFLDVPLFVLGILGVDRAGGTAYRVRTLRGHLALVVLVSMASVASFALALARVCRWSSGRLPSFGTYLLSRGSHVVLAALVVHELLEGVVERARAVLAREIVAVQLPLVRYRRIYGSSTAALP